MLRSLESAPPFFYLAVGAIGATATYLLYPSVKPSRRSRKSVSNGNFFLNCNTILTYHSNFSFFSTFSFLSFLSIKGYPRGLINESNECFINVIVQAIAASCKTSEWLRSNASTTSKMFDTLFKLVSMVNRVWLEVIEEENEEANLTLFPASSSINNNNRKTHIEFINLDANQNEFNAAQILKRALNAKSWKIRTEEHDCHELFHLIMSVLEDELNDKIRSQKSLNLFQQPKISLENSLPTLMPHNPFHGYLAIQLQCLDCNYKVNLNLLKLTFSRPDDRKTDNFTFFKEYINNFTVNSYV